MTINVRGNVSVGDLAGAGSHVHALGPIYDVIVRNIKMARGRLAGAQAKVAAGTYIGYIATEGLGVRSCHGDANLTVTIAGTVYDGTYDRADARFQVDAVRVCWLDYLNAATTAHVTTPNHVAAYVEFNCSTFLPGHSHLQNLQQQRPWLIGPASGGAPIHVGASVSSLAAIDGPRVLYHVIGDFFLYSPDHYTNGYVVTDDSGNLLQTAQFWV